MLGFYSLMNDSAPGNLGLRDIRTALDWVHNNIDDYGGDKNRVTLFGQGGGNL